MFAQKGPGRQDWEADPTPNTDSEARHRTPTPSPSNWEVWAKPNNSSLIQPDLCAKADRDWLRRAGNRTIVPKLGKPDGQRTGTFASKRTIVRLRARSDQPGAACCLAPERTIAEFCDFFWPTSLLGRAPRANNYSVFNQTGKKTNKKNQS